MRTCIVITTINPPTNSVRVLVNTAKPKKWPVIVIGDEKTPENWHMDHACFVSLGSQTGELAETTPKNNYARKNIGYLKAARDGAECIVETDDDNYPRTEFFKDRRDTVSPVCYVSRCSERWFNVYRLFSERRVWPRGFPLEQVRRHATIHIDWDRTVMSPVHQGLVDDDPDVDAVYRLIHPPNEKVTFSCRDRSVVLGPGTWCPCNSQNTTWFEEAFSLMYLPSYCESRLADILRSFVTQRILWESEQNILFHGATAWQDRNEHDLLSDFMSEVPGYLHYDETSKKLEALSLTNATRDLMLRMCYEVLIDIGLCKYEELGLLELWLKEVERCRSQR